MIKGVGRHVVIINKPDKKMFEQAIFVVRSDLFRKGKSEAEIMREANDAAENYLRNYLKKDASLR